MEYYEKQRFHPLLSLFILLPAALTSLPVLMGNEKIQVQTLVGGTIGSIVIALLLHFVRLEVKIDDTGIGYRFRPFQKNYRMALWEDLGKVYIRRYSPLMEYGGWGFRYGFSSGTAVNMSGNTGLQLEFKSGKKLLIGTQRPDELKLFFVNLQRKRFLQQIVS